jgi:hypothetical protein
MDMPVYVRFKFRVASEVAKFPNGDAGAAERKLAGKLAEICQARFSYWHLQAGQDTDFPRLEFSLKKSGLDWVIAGTLVSDASVTAPIDFWSGVLFHPGDLMFTANPTPDTWPKEITTGFEPKFLEANLLDIKKRLRALVPLGNTYAPVVPPPPASVEQAQIILPLDWNHFANIGSSDFLICSHWSHGGIVKLHSTGIGTPAAYPNRPNFQGIVAQLKVWEFASTPQPIDGRLGELANISPYRIYLENEQPAGDALLVDAPQNQGAIVCPPNP